MAKSRKGSGVGCSRFNLLAIYSGRACTHQVVFDLLPCSLTYQLGRRQFMQPIFFSSSATARPLPTHWSFGSARHPAWASSEPARLDPGPGPSPVPVDVQGLSRSWATLWTCLHCRARAGHRRRCEERDGPLSGRSRWGCDRHGVGWRDVGRQLIVAQPLGFFGVWASPVLSSL